MYKATTTQDPLASPLARQEGRREGGKEGRREGGKEGRREGGKEGRRQARVWYVGIDWADDHHDAAVVDEAGHQVAKWPSCVWRIRRRDWAN
jgi:hypothetical protein